MYKYLPHHLVKVSHNLPHLYSKSVLASEEEETFLANFVSDVLNYISSRCVCVCVCYVETVSPGNMNESNA